MTYVNLPAADLQPCPPPVGKPDPRNNDALMKHDQAAMAALACDAKTFARARADAGQIVAEPSASTQAPP